MFNKEKFKLSPLKAITLVLFLSFYGLAVNFMVGSIEANAACYEGMKLSCDAEFSSVVVGGSVGIGTTNPDTALNVGGDVRIGLRTEDNGGVAGYGDYLRFSGGDDWNNWDSDNSDPLWMARYNANNNETELRVNIGDDNGAAEDKFVVGVKPWNSNDWKPQFTVQMNGNAYHKGDVYAKGSKITSDIRLKKNVNSISDSLDKILNI